MSDNHWESQPRKKNGEFTFRINTNFTKKILKKVAEEAVEAEIRKTTRGGSYGFLRKFTAGNKNFEIHHMPSVSSSPLSRWKGPCIIMFKADHKFTSSYKNARGAERYRRWQAKLISEGKFLEAEFMDIKNIQRKCGDRYDKAIMEKLVYEEELEKAGVING